MKTIGSCNPNILIYYLQLSEVNRTGEFTNDTNFRKPREGTKTEVCTQTTMWLSDYTHHATVCYQAIK